MVPLLFALSPALATVTFEAEPLDVVLVPGCPSNADGTLSKCQWERAAWAAHLWETESTQAFITSGNAVYNRYIEAEALKAGIVALGVPEEVVYTETQALHSDENAGFAIEMMDDLDMDSLGVATHVGHTGAITSMTRGWGHKARNLRLRSKVVRDRLNEPLPEVRTEPVPEEEWLPLKERERELARRKGVRPRLNSWFVYFANGVKGIVGVAKRPRPPVKEPSLEGERHRVDTRAWEEDSMVDAAP